MKKITGDEYLALPSDEKVAYDYKKSIFILVMKKGIVNMESGRATYTLPLTNCNIGGNQFTDLTIDANEDMWATIGGVNISSDDWVSSDCGQIWVSVSDERFLQVKDIFCNPLNIGDSVAFIYSFSRQSKQLVKAEIENIVYGTTEGGCRVTLRNFQLGDWWISEVLGELPSLNLNIKYKLASSLMKI